MTTTSVTVNGTTTTYTSEAEAVVALVALAPAYEMSAVQPPAGSNSISITDYDAYSSHETVVIELDVDAMLDMLAEELDAEVSIGGLYAW